MIRRSVWFISCPLILGFAAWSVWWWWDGGGESAEQVVSAEGGFPGGEPPPTLVTLTDAKREAAGIDVVPVARRMFQPTHQVPGRLQYDDTRHVEIKAAADGVVRQTLVKPGDRVEAGDVLLVLNSPEVGLARADVLKRKAEWELAERQLQWQKQTDGNLQELLRDIEARRSVEEIDAQFKSRPLGDLREKLLVAYTRFLLAAATETSILPAKDTGAVTARTVRERSSERRLAEAALRSASEQTAFDSQQQCAAAVASAEDARRRLEIAQQHLAAWLGYDERFTDKTRATSSPTGEDSAVTLSQVECRAPFAGTIESRRFSVSERVRQGDTLLVLANTSRLWVVADLREQDWKALQLPPDQTLELELPAIPQRRPIARLHYVGREVDPETNAIPLVAVVENPDGLMRPGLFARVFVPLGAPREAIGVPSTAVVEHEGQTFVFVAESGNSYRRVDVRCGEQSGGWTEIRAGLDVEMPVVSRGTFHLKSELLLEPEE